MGNPANHPAVMRLPAPTNKKEEISMERIMDTLPVQDLMSSQIAVTAILSSLPVDEVIEFDYLINLNSVKGSSWAVPNAAIRGSKTKSSFGAVFN